VPGEPAKVVDTTTTTTTTRPGALASFLADPAAG